MLKNPISLLKEKITQYLHLKFELIRLEIIERLVNVMGYFAFIMIAIFLAFIFSLFVLFAIAESLKVLFDSYVYAYLTTAGIILVVCIITAMLSKKIIRFFAGKMAELLTKSYHSEETDAANDSDL